MPLYEIEVDDRMDVRNFKDEVTKRKKLRQRLENQRKIRRDMRVDAAYKVGNDWKAARKVFGLPKIETENNDLEVKQ